MSKKRLVWGRLGMMFAGQPLLAKSPPTNHPNQPTPAFAIQALAQQPDQQRLFDIAKYDPLRSQKLAWHLLPDQGRFPAVLGQTWGSTKLSRV